MGTPAIVRMPVVSPGWIRVVALAVVGCMVLAVVADGVRGFDPGTRDSVRPLPLSAPEQLAGSAAGLAHVAVGRPNRDLPPSERSRYPLSAVAPSAVLQNPAAVRDVRQSKVKGFTKDTSRELPELRETHQRVFANADGTRTTEFSASPMHFRRPDGQLAAVDPRLVDDGAGWRNVADAAVVRIARRADAAELVRFAVDGERSVAYGLVGALAVHGRLEESAVRFSGVLPATDLRLESLSGSVKETVVLHSATAPTSLDFPLRLEGLRASVVDGSVQLADEQGTVRAVIPPGFMVDAAGELSRGVHYELISTGVDPTLRVSLDEAWLRAPDRRFPVEVDPTVSLPLAAGSADSSMYVQGGGSASGSSELRVGRQGSSNAASYLKFGSLVDRLRHHTIFKAYLAVVNFDAGSCRARPVSVHPVTAAWSPGTGYSYPGPAVGSAVASKSFSHGYVEFGASGTRCPADVELINLGEGGTRLVQGWVDGSRPNNGISLRASASDTAAFKKFTGPGTANPPKLFVTHSPYNASYSIPKPVPNPPVLQNQAGKVRITVTNKSAEPWAPADYYLAYRVYDAMTGRSVGQHKAASLPWTVGRGGKVHLDATIKPLLKGRYVLDFTMVRVGGKVFTDYQVPPGRIVLQVFDIPPVVADLSPPNGYRPPTLTPHLWARGVDVDAPPGVTMTFKFEVCEKAADGSSVNCFNSGYSASQSWVVPDGKLLWNKTYLWRAFVKDGTSETPSPKFAMITSVPQPDITADVANAARGPEAQEFDAKVGNWNTSAVDAAVVTAGPALSVVRSYNSADPRRDSLFGAGWFTTYDMKVVPDDDGSGNVVVSYPDGQEVRFGRNPDGTMVAPQGRIALLAKDLAGNWTLKDRTGTVYAFATSGKLAKITDISGRSVILSYGPDGRLTKAQVNNSQSNTAGRKLTFAFNGSRIASVSTDPGSTWTYSYTGDLLTRVCGPDNECTNYEYAAGTHYRTAVLDSRPEAYWRLGDSEATGAASEVSLNLGKDAGTHRNTVTGATGPLPGASDTATDFNGTSSYVELPKGTLKRSRDAAFEMWFKTPNLGTGGPLMGYQDKAVGTAATRGVPLLYVGTDGKLRGQLAGGTIAPVTSATPVNDGRWHHVVLSSDGASQTLYLDGLKVGSRDGQAIDASQLTFNQIGAGYATTPASWPGWGSTSQRHFTGTIDEVAVFAHPLGAAAVARHHKLGTAQADQLSKITLPSGKVAAESAYDTDLDRLKEHTDRHGGTWKIGPITTYGNDHDLRRSVEVRDPANRPTLYEYDAMTGNLLRLGSPAGLGMRDEDRPGEPVAPPEPVEECTQPDPGDPKFCTVVPDSSTGPVFATYSLEGMSIRTFAYDERGLMTTATNENGDKVTLTYDDRGNNTSRKTCRTATECYTSYSTFPATITDPFDPRNDLVLEERDGRSASATDNLYRTSYSYHPSGQLASQTNPDGGVVRHTYTSGTQAAYGGGYTPAGLLATTTDARNAVTRNEYFQNGDLAKVTEPSGLVRTYSYDALGRGITETEVSDSFPDGVTTTTAYDDYSRPVTSIGPVTTNAVDGVRHQSKTNNTYDADGNLIKVDVTDLLGGDPARVSTTDYDEHNRPIQTVDPEGGETNHSYDHFGNRMSTVDANGNRWDYGYTARNKLAEVRLRNVSTATPDYLVTNSYAYHWTGELASETDAMGRRVEHAYHGDGLLKSSTLKNFRNPDGSTRDFVLSSNTYDGAGHVTKQVTHNGKLTTQHTVDRVGQVTSTVLDPGGLNRTSTFSYDLNGNLTRAKQSGNSANVPWPVTLVEQITDYGYDLAGRQTSETRYQGSDSRVTSHTYDQRGLRTSTTDPRAFTTNFAYDELGRPIRAIAPPVAAEQNGGAAQTVRPTSTVGYNTFGDQVTTADPLGTVRTLVVDRLGRPTEVRQPSYVPPGGAAITPTTQLRYDGLGNLIERIDPRGNTTKFTYDKQNRVLTRDEPGATNTDRRLTSLTYTHTGLVSQVVDPSGATIKATYDDLDRKITHTEVERYPVANNFTTTLGYDDHGNLTTQRSPSGVLATMAYSTVGERTKITDPAGAITQFGYDFAGRTVRQSDGLGRTSRTDYNLYGEPTIMSDLNPAGVKLRERTTAYDKAGNLVTVTNPLGRTTTYTPDSLGRLAKQVEPVSATETITTTFGYDAAGNRTRHTDGRGNATITTYNSLGLPESTIEPSTAAHPAPAHRTWTVGYDAAGNPVSQSAPGGVSRLRTFDAANRLTKETGAGADTATVDRVLSYDPVDRVLSASAPGGANTYTYNDRDGLLTAQGPGGTTNSTYNADGDLVERTDAAGTTTFTYANARLATTTDGVTGTTQRYGYNQAGQIKSIDYGSGRLRTFGYDDLRRPASDELRNSANAVVASLDYQYDLTDSLIKRTSMGTAGAGEHTYTYDHANRLTSTTAGSTTTTYGWDAAGNRTLNGADTAIYDERNRVMADGDSTYTYTPRGTLKTLTNGSGTQQHTFDAFDRMTTAADQSYAYDSLNRLATRNGVGFAYSGQGLDVTAHGSEKYGRGTGGEVVSLAQGSATRLAITDLHTDMIGTINPADTALPALADSTAFDPFGKRTAQTGTTGSLGFQSDYTDPTTGNVDMGARWYNPGTGGFTARDSLGYSGGDSVLANRYTYGAADPLRNIDPDGHSPCDGEGKSPNRGSGGSDDYRLVSHETGPRRPFWDWGWGDVTDLLYRWGQRLWGGGRSGPGGRGGIGGGIGGMVGGIGGGSPCGDTDSISQPPWPSQTAADAREAAAQRSARAKAKIARNAKNRAIPGARDEARRLANNLRDPVSTNPKVPAERVDVKKNVVKDTARDARDLYRNLAKTHHGTLVKTVASHNQTAADSDLEGPGGCEVFKEPGCGVAVWCSDLPPGATPCSEQEQQVGKRYYGTPLGQEDSPFVTFILDAVEWVVENSEYIAGGAQACASVVPGVTPQSAAAKGACAGTARLFGWISSGKAALKCATDNRCEDYLMDLATRGAFKTLRNTFRGLSPEQQRRMERRLGLTDAGQQIVPKLHQDLQKFKLRGSPGSRNCIAMGFDCN